MERQDHQVKQEIEGTALCREVWPRTEYQGLQEGLGFALPEQRERHGGGEENRQEGKAAITGIFFLLNTCNGRGKAAKAEHRTTLPEGQERGSFCLTFQTLLLHHRDLTSWELLIKTPSDKAMLNSKHALTNYIPRQCSFSSILHSHGCRVWLLISFILDLLFTAFGFTSRNAQLHNLQYLF